MKHMNNYYGLSRVFGKAGLKLQLFAEEDTGDDSEDDQEGDTEEDQEDDQEEDKEKKKKGRLYTKKELGVIVAREVKKALESNDKKTEAEKLKDMTEEERAAYDQKQKDDKMAELERKIARMELSETASKLLKESDIEPSDEILCFIVGKDAEETKENIERFVKIKDAIVLAADKARNTGKTPKVVGGSDKKELTKDDLAKMSYKEVLAFKQKNPEKYKKIMEE